MSRDDKSRPQAAWVDGICKTCGAYTHSCKCEHPAVPGGFEELFRKSFAKEEAARSSIEPPAVTDAMVKTFLNSRGIYFLADYDVANALQQVFRLLPVSATRQSILEDAAKEGDRVRRNATFIAQGLPQGEERARWESHAKGADEVAYSIRQLRDADGSDKASGTSDDTGEKP